MREPAEPAEKRARTAEETAKVEFVRITVQKISGGELYTLKVASDSTLADLRAEIGKAESCSTANLFFALKNGDVLEHSKDGSSLADCNLNDGVTVTLIKGMSTEASFKEEEGDNEIEQKCKRIYTNDHDQFRTAWFFHTSRQTRQVYLVGLEGFCFEVESNCHYTVPCDRHGIEMIEGPYRNLYGIGHAGGQIFLEAGCFSKSLRLICQESGDNLCPWLDEINFEQWGFTVSESHSPGANGELAGMEEAADENGADDCLKSLVVPKLRENGEEEECSVVAGMVKSLCKTMEEEEEGKTLKEALEKQGYQTKEVLRKWALSALSTYDATFPQTNPLEWWKRGDCSWEDFRLPGDCLGPERDSDSSPASGAGKESDADKDSSNADGGVSDDGDDGDDDDNGDNDKDGVDADGDADVEGEPRICQP